MKEEVVYIYDNSNRVCKRNLNSCLSALGYSARLIKLVIKKEKVHPKFLNYLKRLKFEYKEEGKFLVFKNLNFAEVNLLRYSYLYKDTLVICLELFGRFSKENLYFAMVLSTSYWQTNFKNFGGGNYRTMTFIQLKQFKKCFKNVEGSLFIFFSKTHFFNRSQINTKNLIASRLKKKEYREAIELMKTIETNCDFQKDLKKLIKKLYG